MWPAQVIPVPPKDSLNPQKQQLHLVLDYWSLTQSINAAHNGRNIISYYPLPYITDLLARLQKCKIFSSLDLRSGNNHIGLMLEAKPKTTFATTSGEWHWNVTPFRICLLPGVFCCLMSHVLSIKFLHCVYDDILVYSTSWKEHLQHLEMIFKCLKEANLKKISLANVNFQTTSTLSWISDIQTRYSATTTKGHSNRKIKGTQ